MDGWSIANWYVIYTKPKQEDVAAANVQRLGFEVLLPKIKRDSAASGTPPMAAKALFSRYLFARFCPLGHLNSIRYARGVHSVVSAGTTPLPLDEAIIESLRKRIGEDGCVRVDRRTFTPGDLVVVREGPLKGWMGVFERDLSDRERVQILLHTLEYQGRVCIDKLCLERALQ